MNLEVSIMKESQTKNGMTRVTMYTTEALIVLLVTALLLMSTDDGDVKTRDGLTSQFYVCLHLVLFVQSVKKDSTNN